MIEIRTGEFDQAIAALHARNDATQDPAILARVQFMQDDVRRTGEAAVLRYTREFDRVPESFSMWVSEAEIQAAYAALPESTMAAFDRAIQNIRAYHGHQIPRDWTASPQPGVTYGARYAAIETVGLYVPGGRAVYPSTILMGAIPARIAGVKNVIMVTPPRPDGTVHPAVLVAADRCGVTQIFKVGGAQAIFALAYGTATIPKVDKIVGPGNAYVTLAKQLVYGTVDIDKPAGPSEIAVIIDRLDYATFAAADMLAQLEHGPDSVAVVLTADPQIADAVAAAFNALLKRCARVDILQSSAANARIFLSGSDDETAELTNAIASEHLVILSDTPEVWLRRIRHAGSIFLGPYSPVTLGDYYAGPNHVLPTSGTARFASPLGVMDFMKYSSVCGYSRDALRQADADLKTLTGVEGLDAHYLAVDVRLNGYKSEQ
ncbi:MAG: histidinol dehydrogenase [Candidatus Margulisiibacteriota bacterium]